MYYLQRLTIKVKKTKPKQRTAVLGSKVGPFRVQMEVAMAALNQEKFTIHFPQIQILRLYINYIFLVIYL